MGCTGRNQPGTRVWPIEAYRAENRSVEERQSLRGKNPVAVGMRDRREHLKGWQSASGRWKCCAGVGHLAHEAQERHSFHRLRHKAHAARKVIVRGLHDTRHQDHSGARAVPLHASGQFEAIDGARHGDIADDRAHVLALDERERISPLVATITAKPDWPSTSRGRYAQHRPRRPGRRPEFLG